MSDIQKGYTFKWKIENFSMLPHQKGEFLKSPIFVIDGLEDTKCYLMLYPRGNNTDESKDYMSVYFYKIPKNVELKLNITLSIEAGKSTSDITRTGTNVLLTSFLGYSTFCSLKNLFAKKHWYLPQDILTLRFHVELVDTDLAVSKESEKVVKSLKNICVFRSGIQVMQRTILCPIYNTSTRTENVKIHLSDVLKETPGLKLSLIFNETSNYVCVPIEIQQTQPILPTEEQERLFVKCRLSVIGVDKQYQDSEESSYLFNLDLDDVWHFPPFIKISNLARDKYLNADETLHLMCEFTFSYKDAVYHWNSDYKPGTFGLSTEPKSDQFSTSLQRFFATGQYSDVQLKVGDETLLAYKVVLLREIFSLQCHVRKRHEGKEFRCCRNQRCRFEDVEKDVGFLAIGHLRGRSFT